MATKKAKATETEAKEKKTTVKPAAKKSTPKKTSITESDIRKKAEEIFQKRLATGEEGDHVSDWLKAEEALKGTKKK